MEQRIEGARADAIIVLCKFFDQPQAIDGLFGRMMEDVQFDESREEIQTCGRIFLGELNPSPAQYCAQPDLPRFRELCQIFAQIDIDSYQSC